MEIKWVTQTTNSTGEHTLIIHPVARDSELPNRTCPSCGIVLQRARKRVFFWRCRCYCTLRCLIELEDLAPWQ